MYELLLTCLSRSKATSDLTGDDSCLEDERLPSFLFLGAASVSGSLVSKFTTEDS